MDLDSHKFQIHAEDPCGLWRVIVHYDDRDLNLISVLVIVNGVLLISAHVVSVTCYSLVETFSCEGKDPLQVCTICVKYWITLVLYWDLLLILRTCKLVIAASRKAYSPDYVAPSDIKRLESQGDRYPSRVLVLILSRPAYFRRRRGALALFMQRELRTGGSERVF